MNPPLLRSLRLLALVLLAAASLPAQTADDLNEGSRLVYDSGTDSYTFSWWGRAGYTYFVQHSEDLVTWHYVPIVESGADAVIEWGFTSTGQRLFLRLRHTDETVADPESADFDGDGLSNLDEVATYGTDPFSADTDADGMDDGEELIYLRDPTRGAIADDGSKVGLRVFQPRVP